MKNNKVITWRTGYAGSGFSFYFVRCADRKSFEKYAKDKGGYALAGLGVPVSEIDGLTVCQREETLPGVLKQSAPAKSGGVTHFLVDTYIIVPAAEAAIVNTEERTRWYHEIGHAVDWCAQHMAIVRQDHGIRAEGHCSDEETRALLNEFLMASLDKFLLGAESHATSGLMNAMPWAKEVKHV